MKLYNLALLAALAALAAPAPGCGNGSGAPAATGPVTSVPRTVDGITFTQSADKAVYAVGEPILITYGAAASNLSNGANFAATNALLPFIQGVAVAGATQLPLFGPAASGTDTGDLRPAYSIVPGETVGATMPVTVRLPPGTYSITTYLNDAEQSDPRLKGTLGTAANPITIKVVAKG